MGLNENKSASCIVLSLRLEDVASTTRFNEFARFLGDFRWISSLSLSFSMVARLKFRVSVNGLKRSFEYTVCRYYSNNVGIVASLRWYTQDIRYVGLFAQKDQRDACSAKGRHKDPTRVACYAPLSFESSEDRVVCKNVEFPRFSLFKGLAATGDFRKDLPICGSQFESGYKSE